MLLSTLDFDLYYLPHGSQFSVEKVYWMLFYFSFNQFHWNHWCQQWGLIIYVLLLLEKVLIIGLGDYLLFPEFLKSLLLTKSDCLLSKATLYLLNCHWSSTKQKALLSSACLELLLDLSKLSWVVPACSNLTWFVKVGSELLFISTIYNFTECFSLQAC